MAVTARWLRRAEIACAAAGILSLGGAFAVTAGRWSYQNRQEIAIERDGAVPVRQGRRGPTVPGAVHRAADPLALGRIEIARVGIRAIVREGTDDATLALAVGHVEGTARPGQNGNVVLAGHRDTFFRGLRHIRVDDGIRIVAPPRTWDYRVVSLDVVAPDDLRVLAPTGEESLTLITCYPFQYVGRAPERFIVRASRVRRPGGSQWP